MTKYIGFDLINLHDRRRTKEEIAELERVGITFETLAEARDRNKLVLDMVILDSTDYLDET